MSTAFGFGIVGSSVIGVQRMPSTPQEDMRKRLVDATVAGDRKLVEQLLDQGANPNAPDDEGWTSLHHAAALARPEIAELLLLKGADPSFASTGSKQVRGREWPAGTRAPELAAGPQLRTLFAKAAQGKLRKKPDRKVPVPASSAVVAKQPELLARLQTDPDNREPYEVYADWLQSQGDPRGDWIALNLRAEDKLSIAQKAARTKAENQLLAANPNLRGPAGDPKLFDAVWKWGFLQALRVKPGEVGERFAALWADPGTRLLRELHLPIVMVRPMTEVLSKLEPPSLPCLRTVVLRREGADEIHPPDLQESWQFLQPASRLVLQDTELQLKPMTLPTLRELYFDFRRFMEPDLRALEAAKLPQLEVLHLPSMERDVQVDELIRLLAPGRFPKLRVLSLEGWAAAVDSFFFRGLLKSGLLAQLEELHLGAVRSFRVLSRLMIGHADQLSHLKRVTMNPSPFHLPAWDELCVRLGDRVGIAKASFLKQVDASLAWPLL